MAKANNVPESEVSTKAGFVPKIKKALTLPVLKLVKDVPTYIRFDSPMRIGKKVEADKDPAIVADVTDLETGEVFQFLVPAVVQGVLHDEFGAPKFGKLEAKGDIVELDAGDGLNRYVGQGFEITDKGKAEGKKYKGMTVQLLDLD